MIIDIPGYKKLDLQYLLLDYNGTIALDGTIPDSVKERLQALSESFEIYVLTADTHGTAKKMCEGLPVIIHTFPSDAAAAEKKRILHTLGADHSAAIGNGRNDMMMCTEAALGISILGTEGAYGKLIASTEVCVPSIEDGLDLFLNPKRLIATLRG